MTNELKRAIKFLKELHKKIQKHNKSYKKYTKYKTKKDFQIDPVTKFDLNTELLIRNEINKNFKGHNIVGEEFEEQNKNSKFTWYLDPIDGTKSLIMGLPNWSNLIGLYYEDKCILSYANFPILNKFYIAYNSKAYVVSKNIKKIINCNKLAKIRNMKLTINTLHSIRERKIYNYLRQYKGFFKITGVDALNFCSIAEGKFDVLIESGLKKIDIFPIRMIVENSGAILTDWEGGVKFEKGRVLVAPNKKIHNYYLKILKKL